MSRDQASVPYYIIILLQEKNEEALKVAIQPWEEATVCPGTWALVNFDKWNAAYAAAGQVDAYFDSLGIKHTVTLNSRYTYYRKWSL